MVTVEIDSVLMYLICLDTSTFCMVLVGRGLSNRWSVNIAFMLPTDGNLSDVFAL